MGPATAAAVHAIRRVRLADGRWAARKAVAPAARGREEVALRLRWEGECLLRLGGRRHVLGCHAVEEGPEGPALLLEWAPGGSLAERLRRGGPLGAEALRALAVALGGALGHVHAAGLVHRDVKPSNVLFAADGTARLADFGVAARVGARGVLSDSWEEGPVGTAGFAAPEQLAGAAAEPAADVYGLAAVLRAAGADVRRGLAEDPRGRGTVGEVVEEVVGRSGWGATWTT